MAIRAKFDLKRAGVVYSKALAHMAKLSGLDTRKIVLAEAGVILKTCAARTKVATASKLRDGARLSTLRGMELTKPKQIGEYEFTVNAGKKAPYGRVWTRKNTSNKWQMVFGNDFSRVPRHFAEQAWRTANFLAKQSKVAVRKGIDTAKQRAGLARGSWVLIADSLGISLENVRGGQNIAASAIQKARRARARGNKQINNGRSREEAKAKSYFVTLINGLPYGRRIGLDRMLTIVMANRVKFFANAVKAGYRGSLAETAKLFPGWVQK